MKKKLTQNAENGSRKKEVRLQQRQVCLVKEKNRNYSLLLVFNSCLSPENVNTLLSLC